MNQWKFGINPFDKKEYRIYSDQHPRIAGVCRMNRISLAVLIMCGMMSAAPLPDAPSATRKPSNPYLAPFRQPEFYISVGTFTASEFYDIHSTQVCERQRTCVEAYAGHDRYAYALPLVGLVAAGTYGCQLMLYQHKWWRRTVCSGLGIGMSIIHWKDGSTIYHVNYTARR